MGKLYLFITSSYSYIITILVFLLFTSCNKLETSPKDLTSSDKENHQLYPYLINEQGRSNQKLKNKKRLYAKNINSENKLILQNKNETIFYNKNEAGVSSNISDEKGNKTIKNISNFSVKKLDIRKNNKPVINVKNAGFASSRKSMINPRTVFKFHMLTILGFILFTIGFILGGLASLIILGAVFTCLGLAIMLARTFIESFMCYKSFNKEEKK